MSVKLISIKHKKGKIDICFDRDGSGEQNSLAQSSNFYGYTEAFLPFQGKAIRCALISKTIPFRSKAYFVSLHTNLFSINLSTQRLCQFSFTFLSKVQIIFVQLNVIIISGFLNWTLKARQTPLLQKHTQRYFCGNQAVNDYWFKESFSLYV